MLFDPSEAQVEIYGLHRDNEELMAYMKPTPEQREQIRKNCVRIATLALQINDWYKVN